MAVDRVSALWEGASLLARRTLAGASAQELARLASSELGPLLGEEAAVAFAAQLAALSTDPEADETSSVAPLRSALELTREASRRILESSIAAGHYRTLLDHSSDGIALIGPQGHYLEMNPRGCEMLGYSREEMLKLRIFDLVLASESPVDMAAIETGEPVVRRRQLRRKDGTLLTVEIGARSIPGGGMFGIFRDVTEHERDRQRAEERAQRFSHALRAARAGAWELDLATGASRWSDEMYTLMGLPVGDGNETYATGMDRLHPDDREAADRAVRRAIAEGAELDLELRFPLSDGTYRWFRTSGKTALDADGVPVAMYGIHIDINESKESELARASAEAQLQQASRMEAVGRLAGGIAHDFNNLLTVVLTASDMLATHVPPTGRAADHLLAIRDAAQRGASVTRQLLGLSRSQPAKREALDVGAQVERMVPILQRLLGEDIEIRTSPDAGPHVVKMDPGQLDQIILNLAINARDAMPRGGALALETCTEAGADDEPRVVLSVRDTGVGMDEETRARAFEPFYTTKPHRSGTGLGLATVYGIVMQSGGTIDIESSPLDGTCFRITLPGTSDEVTLVGEPATEARKPRRGVRVLLVEDEAAVRRLVRAALEEEGHRVLEAANGSEALELVRSLELPLDLVVTDVVMPGMSGPELVRTLRESTPRLCALFMSGYLGDALTRYGLTRDVALLEKPFTPAQLLDRVARALA